MTHLIQKYSCPRSSRLPQQRGVILIVTLIMLLIISGVAALAIKGAGSTEIIANNTRTQGLAMAAAEAALRYCEIGAVNKYLTSKGKALPAGQPTHTITIDAAPALVSDKTNWEEIASWQSSTVKSATVSLDTLDKLGDASATSSGASTFAVLYKRNPDCIAQYAFGSTTVVLVTARGFGPEVAKSDNNQDIPNGAEVFLQSTIKMPP
jgi:type IV pilus assembly protein PilX